MIRLSELDQFEREPIRVTEPFELPEPRGFEVRLKPQDFEDLGHKVTSVPYGEVKGMLARSIDYRSLGVEFTDPFFIDRLVAISQVNIGGTAKEGMAIRL